jgi:hypothetical protein
MTAQTQTRLTNLLLVGITIPAGLWTRRLKLHYPTLGDMLGDALYATMVFFLAGVIFPRWTMAKRALVALIFAFCIEFTQLYHRPWIDQIRSTSLGATVLGYTFAWQDLICYALGVVLGVIAATLLAKTAKNVRA